MLNVVDYDNAMTDDVPGDVTLEYVHAHGDKAAHFIVGQAELPTSRGMRHYLIAACGYEIDITRNYTAGNPNHVPVCPVCAAEVVEVVREHGSLLAMYDALTC